MDRALTFDPMEVTRIGAHMWTQAVAKAESTDNANDTEKVIVVMASWTFQTRSALAAAVRRRPSPAMVRVLRPATVSAAHARLDELP